MYAYAAWDVDASQILSRRELALVLTSLKKRAARLPNVQMNLAICTRGLLLWPRSAACARAGRLVALWMMVTPVAQAGPYGE